MSLSSMMILVVSLGGVGDGISFCFSYSSVWICFLSLATARKNLSTEKTCQPIFFDGWLNCRISELHWCVDRRQIFMLQSRQTKTNNYLDGDGV